MAIEIVGALQEPWQNPFYDKLAVQVRAPIIC